MATTRIVLGETVHTAAYIPPPPKQPVKKKKYFNNLDGFLNEYSFKVTALPWRYENDHYIINQSIDEDSYGFAIYSIIPKRFFDDSSFIGRLPNSKFASEILMAIAEDYLLENLNSSPQGYPDERDDVFLSDLAIQTDLRKNKNIHISIDYTYIDSSTFEYTWAIRYFPKAKEHLKRGNDELIESFQAYGGSYSGAWKTYEEALHEAIKKVCSNILYEDSKN